MRTHDTRKNDHDRTIERLRIATRGALQRHEILGALRQWPKDCEFLRFILDQPVAQCRTRVVVRKVAKVRDIGTAIEKHPRSGLRRDASEHRRRVDHEVVVDVVEKYEVGEQHAQLSEQVSTLDVAGDHRHLNVRTHRGLAQQPCHGRIGEHGLDAGDQVRIGAVLRDLDDDPLECRVVRITEQERHLPDQRQHTGQEQIEVPAREERSVGRTGDSDIALDHQPLFTQ